MTTSRVFTEYIKQNQGFDKCKFSKLMMCAR